MEKKIVKLQTPITIGGVEKTEVEVRASTIGDEEDALQEALRLKKGKNALTIEMCLFSKVSKIPYDVLRSMNRADYGAIRDAVNEVNGIEPEDDGENPLTP